MSPPSDGGGSTSWWARTFRRASPPPGARIADLAIVTCNRPRLLARAIESYATNLARHGRDATLTVVDASSGEDGVLSSVRAATRSCAVPIRHIGPRDRRLLTRRLVDAGYDTDVLEAALSPPAHLGWAPGANRNLLALASAGRPYLSVDDDTVCTFGPMPSDPRLALARADTTRFSLYGSIDDRRRAVGDGADADLLALHERVLGKLVRECERTLDKRAEGDAGADRSSCDRFLRGSVVATWSGYVGDAATENPLFYLVQRGETRERLLRTEKAFRAAFRSRQLRRAPEAITLTSGGFFTPQVVGLDARTTLPPFFPIGRGQGALFGRMTMATTSGLFALLPEPIVHDPDPRVQDEQALDRIGQNPSLARLLCAVAERMPKSIGGNPSARLSKLGAAFRELGGLSAGSFADWLHAEREELALALHARLDALLDEHGHRRASGNGGSSAPSAQSSARSTTRGRRAHRARLDRGPDRRGPRAAHELRPTARRLACAPHERGTVGCRERCTCALTGRQDVPLREMVDLAHEDDLTEGQLVGGRHRVISLLGRGGMGVVWKAVDERTGQPVAIKVLLRRLMSRTALVERFYREATVASLPSHPHIVRVLDAGSAKGDAPYLVMEYLEGITLAEAIRRGGKLETQRAVRLGRQILSALEAVHALGLVHRDLKPANVMLVAADDGREAVKIVDFGLARPEHGPRITQTGQVLGTPPYMPPEQALGGVLDARSDLYSAGAILFCMLSGRRPIEGSGFGTVVRELLEDRRPRIDEIVLGIGPLGDVVERAMAFHPEDRYASAREMEHALAMFDAEGATRTIEQWRSSVDMSTLVARLRVPTTADDPHEVVRALLALRAVPTTAAPQAETVAARVRAKSREAAPDGPSERHNIAPRPPRPLWLAAALFGAALAGGLVLSVIAFVIAGDGPSSPALTPGQPATEPVAISDGPIDPGPPMVPSSDEPASAAESPATAPRDRGDRGETTPSANRPTSTGRVHVRSTDVASYSAAEVRRNVMAANPGLAACVDRLRASGRLPPGRAVASVQYAHDETGQVRNVVVRSATPAAFTECISTSVVRWPAPSGSVPPDPFNDVWAEIAVD